MVIFTLPNDLKISIIEGNSPEFSICGYEEALRYLKGIYTNKERFKSRFLKKINHVHEIKEIVKYFEESYDHVKPFSYREAFEIKNQEFKAKVFGSIDIIEMIQNLGKKKLKVDGIPMKNKNFDKNGVHVGDKIYDNIFETYEVDGKMLGIEKNLYVVKCWCTSTNDEHWIWIEEKYKDDPLNAIASTFRIHSNIIPHIKEIKRQGDILLVELTKDINPEGEIVPLTKEQYFGLLTSES